MEYFFYGLILLLLLLAIVFPIGRIIQLIHYRVKYTDDRGWHKCYKCGDANELMFFEDFIWGRYYKCDKCFTNEIKEENETKQN